MNSAFQHRVRVEDRLSAMQTLHDPSTKVEMHDLDNIINIHAG